MMKASRLAARHPILTSLAVYGVTLALMLLVGCASPKPKPKPPTPPPVVTPSPVCQPGATCGCYHQPPGQDWQKLPDCETTPPVVPPAKPPATCEFNEHTAVPMPDTAPPSGKLLGVVNDMIVAMGDTTGAPPQATLHAAASQIKAAGWCAVAGIEAIFIRDGARWYEFHVVYFGNGSMIPGGKYMGAHRAVRDVEPPVVIEPPVVTPPPADYLCGEPMPPPMRDFGVHVGRWWVDATASLYGCNYKGPGTNYCRDIGLGEMPGQPGVERCDCPAGNEDNPIDRSCREAWVVGGKPLWRSDGKVTLHETNPFLARCEGCTWIEICRADGTKCTRAKL
jgi:hypothetical protein